MALKMQTETAGGERTAGEIALHLRLIGPEIGEREKESAEQARPKSVAPLRIEREIDRVEFPHFPGDRRPLRRNDTSAASRCTIMPKATPMPGEDDGHLPFIACG